MAIKAARLEVLLRQINDGRAAKALPDIDRLLQQQPTHSGALALRAEALRLLGRLDEAVQAYKRAGDNGAGGRNWLVAGVLLAAERKSEEAYQCLLKALAESPGDEQILDTLITTLFNANRHQEALEFARRQLETGRNPHYLSNAALLLQSVDLYEESSAAFKKIIALAPDDPALVGAALGPTRFTCEWEWIESLQQRLNAWYEQGQFGAPQEYPLTHLTWCTDEARNLGVTRAYAERTVPRVELLAAPVVRAGGSRIRVGYLSCDFRNHATMHLMAGLFEAHDQQRFEVFAYDYSNSDISDYRQRFLDAVEHVVPIHSLSDREAAVRIADDRLDVLFDLKVYTGGCRPGILAYRPAPVQVAYLGFPGSAGHDAMDYIVSDRFVTPDSSKPHYTERLCRLPHTYQCNDRKRFAASEPGLRAMHGLPEDKIVYGVFNQSYKVDRESFGLWMRVLQAVPDSVLWMLGQSSSAIENLTRHAQLAGVEPGRVVFAPFADPRDHLARLQLADVILDTLACNGHTTTSDALWAGVPVITCRGSHFASRVSESLLNAIGLPELVASDGADMARLAARIGTDSDLRAALRARVAENRLAAPLFDTARFTRDFETAIEMMSARHRGGQPPTHIDVPDAGPVARQTPAAAVASAVLQATYADCPLCAGASVTLGFADCRQHALWHEPLPPTIEWLRCPTCGHIHSRHYWTDAGRAEILRRADGSAAAAAGTGRLDWRTGWTPVVGKAIGLLGGYQQALGQESRPVWVDVGCGEGGLIRAAADHGFAAVGLDIRAGMIAEVQAMGCNALVHDFMQLRFEVTPDVLSMMDVLGQLADPGAALRKAAQVLRPGGALVVGTTDLMSSGWRMLEAAKANPYWTDIENLHQFSRDRLLALVKEAGFTTVDLSVATRHPAQLELYALRR